jgi:hypothetical protein
VFSWKNVKAKKGEGRFGMPDEFDFSWITFGPSPPRDEKSENTLETIQTLVVQLFQLLSPFLPATEMR